MDFPLEGCISHYLDRCVQWVYVCVHCVFLYVRVCACGCVCVHGKKKRDILKAPLSIWFLHHCSGITLSIVGSLGISSVCNISLIHTSPWALPCRRILSVPLDSAVTLYILWPSLKLSPVWYCASVRTVQVIKLSKLQFHTVTVLPRLSTAQQYIFIHINTATDFPTGMEQNKPRREQRQTCLTQGFSCSSDF